MKNRGPYGQLYCCRVSLLFSFPLCVASNLIFFCHLVNVLIPKVKKKIKKMAPISKNARKSNVKQQAKSIKATNYTTKLRSATVVTPSKDNNSKKNGNLHQAENMESNKNQVRIFQYQTTYVKLSYIFMCIVFFWVPEFLLY